MIQDHTAYPNITNVVVSAVADGGGLNMFRSLDDLHTRLDECIGADGVHHDDLARLDLWLSALPEEDLETVIGGEESDMADLLASAPCMGDPSDTAAGFLNACYEHCI